MKRVGSIFSQILQLVPRDRFEAAVVKHQAQRHSRGFSSWGQFVAMLFCQLAQAKSLREITEGLQASEGQLKHLGLPEAPARSTLAYANGHRTWQLYETVFHQLLADCRRRLGAKAGSKQRAPPEPFRSAGKATALVISEPNSATAELLAQDPILLTEIVDCLLLLLIHPARDRHQHEPERIENTHGSTVSCGIATKRLFGLFSARSSFGQYEN